jgi:hypothetical protein
VGQLNELWKATAICLATTAATVSDLRLQGIFGRLREA